MRVRLIHRMQTAVVLCLAIFSASSLLAQEEEKPRAAPDTKVLDDQQWKQLDASVQRALKWLASKQNEDGSFESPEAGQAGITSLCLMAFMAQGESPSDGKYEQQLAKAIDYLIAQQKANGLIATMADNTVPISRNMPRRISVPSIYSHAISALALCEAYGQCNPEQAKRLTPVIEKAIAATVEVQGWAPKEEKDVGGWRYLDSRFPTRSSDLGVTGWQLMFLRSAKNAGFDVPQNSVEAAVKFVQGCFVEDHQVLAYLPQSPFACTRSAAAAGVLALAHAGKTNSKEALASGDWILKHDFSKYNDCTPSYGAPAWQDRYHYGSALCSQAMFQLGGKYWEDFFPPLVEVLMANQKEDGAWEPESADPQYGNCYTTSLCVLALSVPNQLLPIFQR